MWSYYYNILMTFFEKLKKVFKKTDKSDDILPHRSDTSINNKTIVLETQNAEAKRDQERIAAEKRLSEYLAEEQKRKKTLEEKLYQEIQGKKRGDGRWDDGKILDNSKSPKIQSEQKEFQDPTVDQIRIENLQIEAEKAERERLKGIWTKEQRIEVEEKKKRDEIAEKERKILERERLKYIHDLYQRHFSEYLTEAAKFRQEFGKNIQCDVCGKWEVELYNHRNQTYCEKCIPADLQREYERKITAGKHGAEIDYIKK